MDLNVPVDKQSPVYHQNLVKSARSTLLIAVAFTVLNIVLLLIGSNRYFLYSATIPYYLTFFGYMFDNFMVGTYTLTGLTMAVVPVAVLALSWYLSKQNHRWLMAATVVFVLDTAAMVAMLVWTGDIGASVLDIVKLQYAMDQFHMPAILQCLYSQCLREQIGCDEDTK